MLVALDTPIAFLATYTKGQSIRLRRLYITVIGASMFEDVTRGSIYLSMTPIAVLMV